jgi:hypothetical protein
MSHTDEYRPANLPCTTSSSHAGIVIAVHHRSSTRALRSIAMPFRPSHACCRPARRGLILLPCRCHQAKKPDRRPGDQAPDLLLLVRSSRLGLSWPFAA